MKIRIELTEDEIKEAIKIYTLNKSKLEGYSISECAFIYDEDELDTHTPIDGAILYLTKIDEAIVYLAKDNPCLSSLNE